MSSEGVSRELVIANVLGLHARAAATLVRVAAKFESEVTITKGGQSANGKSILAMMTLAAAKGTPIQVTCRGKDEQQALAAIAECVANKFGEE